MKKIIFTPPARADVRRIDRDTAMRILTALDRFARTGEGDIKKLEGNTGELRLRVGDYRVRLHRKPARHALHSRRPAPLRSLPLTSNTHRTTRLISASPPPLFHLSWHVFLDT